MVRGVKIPKEQLVERFGVSGRLAARADALLRRGVELSAGVLERARPQSPLEQFMLRPELLRQAERLTPDAFAAMAGTESFEPAGRPVLLANDDGSRVIALAGEAEAPRALVRGETAAPAFLSPVVAGLRVISDEESQKLFPADEIARLKMTILASADAAEKVEAVRRLAMSPLEPIQKGTVLIHALADHDRSVRVEAAEALTAFGLNPVIAQAARSLAEGGDKQRIHAGERLGMLADTADVSEASVILAILSGAMGSEESADVKKTLIRSFKGACGIVAGNRAYAAAVLRLLVRELEGAAEALYRTVREILGEVGRHAPDIMTELVIEELSTIKAVPLRRLLFGVLGMFDVPESRRPFLATLAVNDFKGSSNPDEECQGIASMICNWGQVAVGPLLSALTAAEDAQKIYIVRLLDEIGSRGNGVAVEEIAAAFLNLMRVSTKHVQQPVIESRIVAHEKLSAGLKCRIAAELMRGIGHFANPRMTDVIESALVRLGSAAMPAVKAPLAEDADKRTQRSACRVAAGIIERCAAAERRVLADDMLELCQQQWQTDGGKTGYLAEAIGRFAVCSSASGEKLQTITAELKGALFLMPASFGVLVALGHLSSMPVLAIATKFDIAQAFFDLLETSLPDVADKVQPNAGGEEEIHSFGRELTVYTEMIPACLEGLEKIYSGTKVKALRAKVRDFLLAKWQETSAWTRIWGPDAVERLLHILGKMARDPEASTEAAATIANSLAQRLDFLPVVEELAQVFSLDAPSARMGAAACGVGQALLAKVRAKRDAERGILLATLGVIAGRTNLGKDPAEARKLREHVLQLLYEGLKDGRPEAVDALRRVGDCPALPASERDEIRVRLEILAR
ncbi:MAG TPA: hypothetical protein VM141_12560 [Planctomycetota bacterium]|nr:hypothetical protein [Planctomycetota bacterium]